MKLKVLSLMALLCFTLSAVANVKTPSLIAWQPHNNASFLQAAKEKKFLILDLEAVWCHWCHVMDAKTYADPKVAAYIKQHFIPLKADHDARPDLAERYRDWGWPATIVFAPDGTEIVKRAGYIDHHLWITRQQELEQHAAGDYPRQRAAGEGLPQWSGDESIEKQDVVLWYTMTVTHVPRAEEWPVMSAAHSGFALIPSGFFTRNPALDVPRNTP